MHDLPLVLGQLACRLGGEVDLAVVFVSGLLDDPAQHARAAWAASGAGTLIGCTATGVIAGGREIEQAPAVAIWGAWLPGVEISATHMLRTSPSEPGSQIPDAPASRADSAGLIVLADPFTFPADGWLAALDTESRDRLLHTSGYLR